MGKHKVGAMDQITKDKIERIKEKLTEALDILGLDINDPSIQDTPKRIAKMWVKEIFSGLFEPKPAMTTFEAPSDQMVTEIGITVRSTCEHHFQPIYGRAHVAYLPNKKVLGLSKLNRAVDYFARMPQIQEGLTKDIYEFLKQTLDTEDIAVVIDAEHFCVKMRGIKDDNSYTRTTMLGGKFKSDSVVREEFFQAIPRVKFHG